VPTFSLDTPSGLDTTTGRPADPCFQATATLTLALPKRGLLTAEARSVVGRLFLADISVPAVVYARMGLGGQRLFEEWKYRLVRSDAYKDIMCELLEKYVHLDKTTRPRTVADPFYQVFESAQSAKGERV
jgi:hypothetical protein